MSFRFRFLSDKRAVIAIIIGAILAIVAYFLVRPFDRMISYVVFGVALIFFVYACVMDIADDFEPAAKPKPTPKPEVKDVPEPEEEEEHAEEYVPEVEAPAAELSKLPIETIEGIGEVYGKELKAAGIATVADLMVADADKVAELTDVNVEQAERWIAMSRFAWLDEVSEEDAEAIVFATGIIDLKTLAGANAQDIYDKIQTALDEGDVRVPAGYKFDVDTIQTWIDAAKRLT
jgi:predicted flap endonuclease-1-like 5' DNA nuclease